jgi:transcription antitermination factor NusG
MENEMMASTPEVQELRSTLEREMASLKSTHRSIAEKIKAFENKTSSDIGFEVGEEVKLTESGDIATVSSINSSRNTLIVVTSNGRTVEVPAGKAVSIHADLEKANAKNAEEITESSKKKLA